MKGMLRRISAMLLAVVLVLGTGVTVLAAEATTDQEGSLLADSNKVVTTSASVKIQDVPVVSSNGSDTLAASFATYQIVYATYDSTANSLEYHLQNWVIIALVATDKSYWDNLDDKSGSNLEGKYYSEEAVLNVLIASQLLGGATGTKTDGNSATEQSEILNTLALYVVENTVDQFQLNSSNIEWQATTTLNGNDKVDVSAVLPLGVYLILPSSSIMSFLNMMVSVDVSSTENTGSEQWKLTTHDAVLKGKEITLTKTVTDDRDRQTYVGTDKDTAQAKVGDTLYYSLRVDVPQFAANSDDATIEIVFKVTDSPSNLKIDLDSVVVTPYDSSGTAKIALTAKSDTVQTDYGYEASLASDGTLTIDFSDNYLTKFYTASSGTYPYSYVIITYEAELLSTAAVTAGNPNTATLTYGNYTDNTGTATDNATIYTYQMELEKKGKDGDNTVLSNASFKIYTLDGTTKTYLTFIKDSSGNYVVADSTDIADSSVTKYEQITTGTDGKVTLIGLDGSVTYYIEESVAPSGYSLNTNYLEFAITGATDTDSTSTTYGDLTGKIASVSASEYQSGNATAIETYPDNDNTKKGSWTIDVATSNTASLSLTLTDTKLPSLPATGSVGIIIFTIAGVALMIAAVFILYSGKNREKSGGEKA